MIEGYYLTFLSFDEDARFEFITGPHEHMPYAGRHSDVEGLTWNFDGDALYTDPVIVDGVEGTYSIMYWGEDSLILNS